MVTKRIDLSLSASVFLLIATATLSATTPSNAQEGGRAVTLDDTYTTSWDDPHDHCRSEFRCTINSTTEWDANGSLQIAKSGNQTHPVWSYITGDNITVNPAQDYEIITHMKLNKWVMGSHVVVEALNKTSNSWYQLMQCPPGTSGFLDWKEFKCQFLIPSDSSMIRPILNAGWSSQSDAQAITWFDAISTKSFDEANTTQLTSNNLTKPISATETPTDTDSDSSPKMTDKCIVIGFFICTDSKVGTPDY
jgi:hypothetical protein